MTTKVVSNAIINLLGSVLPPIVGVLTIPLIIKNLGLERFGVLSLAWTILLYFSIFDLGLGRATTKFASELIGQNNRHSMGSLFWTSLLLQIVFGLIGGIALFTLGPLLFSSVLKDHADLLDETVTMVCIFCASIPILNCSLTLRGLIEAHESFGLMSIVKIPSQTFNFLGPLLASWVYPNLKGVALFLIAGQLISLLGYWCVLLRLAPEIQGPIKIDIAWMRKLLKYGIWVLIYSMIIPVVMYFDRFAIARMISVAAVVYYTIPFDLLGRLQLIPASFSASLVPAISRISAQNKDSIPILYLRASKYLAITLGSILVLFSGFGKLCLAFWLGASMANEISFTFTLLSIGFFLNGLVWLPNCLFLGIGRPDIIAKLFSLILIFYLPSMLILVSSFGVKGAAIAMVIREFVSVVVFYSVSIYILSKDFESSFLGEHMKLCVFQTCIIVVVTLLSFYPISNSSGATELLCVTVLGVLLLLSWKFLLTQTERLEIGGWVISKMNMVRK